MRPQIRTLKHAEIDRQKWDQCIFSALNARPYAMSWYLDHFSPGWEAVILNDYQAVLPLTARKKYGISYLITPVFIQQLGVFFAEELSAELSQLLLDVISGFSLIDYALNTGNQHQPVGFEIRERKTLELRLDADYTVLKEKYSSNGRRNVRLARESEPKLLNDISPKELVLLFQKHTARRIKGVRKQDYHRLISFMEFALEEKKGKIYAIHEAGEYIYGLFTVEQLDYICCLFTVNSPRSRKARSGYYVIDQLIQRHAGSQKILDFAGSEVPAVAAFMKSFGPNEKSYYRLLNNNLPFPLKRFKNPD